MVGAYEQSRAGQPWLVVIEGEAGLGKTRLAEEIETRGRAIAAALTRLDELVMADDARAEAAAYLRAYSGKRAHILGARSGCLDHDHTAGDGGGWGDAATTGLVRPARAAPARRAGR
jgi:hypothetical protein